MKNLILCAFVALAPITTLRAAIAVDSEPREITKLEDSIVYPISERIHGYDGRVTLDALIDTNGAVIDVTYLYASDSAFWEAAKDAMWKMRFSPAVSNGRRIKVWITRTIHFKLTESGPRKEPSPGDGIPGLG